MKVIILDELQCRIKLNTDVAAPEWNSIVQQFTDVGEVLSNFTVHHNLWVSNELVTFDILPQKITLTEVDMNTLFFNIIDDYFKYELTYAPLGGAGCDFALELCSISK